MSRILLVLVLLLSGCSVGGDQYEVTAEFESAGNLVPRAEVKLDDVNVGSVRAITLDGWRARLTLQLDSTVDLPANAEVRIGQRSLLGGQYVELRRPATPQGKLRAGETIPLARTGSYPETEQLLAALGMWLNGSGLAQVQTIVRELNTALGGREQATRELLTQLATTTSTLRGQTQDLVRLIDAVDGLAGSLAQQRDQLGAAVDRIAPAVTVLAQQRDQLAKLLEAVQRLCTVGNRVLRETTVDTVAIVRDLQPILTQLQAAGDALPESLTVLLSGIPLDQYERVLRDGRLNLFITLDLSLPSLGRSLLPPLQAANPLLAPVRGGR
ncbi:MCE family protein [Pseudonocardiaceae bacterium YIM PH 21723]|nr:MCE family protein [Pseudonocardiaceae bacterium YIM PH 21723]